jgi:TolA-binding protein
MLTRRSLAAVALAALLGAPAQAQSQTLTELIQQGRFEEAVALVGNAGPEEAAEAARAIFNQAYQVGHQRGDYDYAIRGFTAGKRLVDMSHPLYEQLSFWHGFALYSQGVEVQAAQTLASAQIALPMFEQALDLFAYAGDYPTSVNVNMTQLVQAASTYIEIQNAVIRRGRE